MLLSSRVAGWVPRLWESFIPIKFNFCAWEAWHGKMLTMDNLKKRGLHIVNRCYPCLREEESIHHLFIHCEKSSDLVMLYCQPFQNGLGYRRVSEEGISFMEAEK